MHLTQEMIFSFNFIVNVIITLLALTIAYFSFRAHKVAKSYTFGYFSLGFLSMSAAFFVNAFSMIVWAMNATHVAGTLTAYTHWTSMLLFRFFFLLGLVLVLFATRGNASRLKSTISIYLFMVLIVLSLIYTNLFFIVAILLLIFISIHYLINVFKGKNNMSIFVFLSMFLLLFGVIRFLFIKPYFCFIQPILFLVSFLIMYWVVVKAYKN